MFIDSNKVLGAATAHILETGILSVHRLPLPRCWERAVHCDVSYLWLAFSHRLRLPLPRCWEWAVHCDVSYLRPAYSQYTDCLSRDAGKELYIVMCHMVPILPDKQCSLVVTKMYDPDFSWQYQVVMSGNINMRQENIEAINMTHTSSPRNFRDPIGIKKHQKVWL